MTEHEALIKLIEIGGCLRVYPDLLPIVFWYDCKRFVSTSGDRRVCFIEVLQQAIAYKAEKELKQAELLAAANIKNKD